MLIRLSDLKLVPALVGDLEQRVQYVVKQVGDDKVGEAFSARSQTVAHSNSGSFSRRGRPLTLR